MNERMERELTQRGIELAEGAARESLRRIENRPDGIETVQLGEEMMVGLLGFRLACAERFLEEGRDPGEYRDFIRDCGVNY